MVNDFNFKGTGEKLMKPNRSSIKKISGTQDFEEIEKKILRFWEKEGIYKFDSKSKKKIYSMDTPPPTVSGKMHIGHAFSYSQQDFIARYRRMKGENVFYPFGTDDNGLPTERLIEKTLGIKASSMERSEFIKLCLKLLKERFQPEYLRDWKAIGISCDWNLLYSTIDDHSRRISQWSFLDLYKKKRVYRKDAPAMWCPECKTGISQVDCEDKEFDSTFNTIVFRVDGKDLLINTTRPELLPACVAIFYNPKDKRYKHLKGKKAKIPLFDFEVSIMEDKRADPEKGTGIVMNCTFGDQTDMEWQKAYNLPIKEVLTKGGRLNDLAGKYEGMNIKQARKKILEDLKDAGLLKKQIPIKHNVKVHDRCGTEIEFIKSKQWFVKYLDLKEEMIKWGEKLNWYPKFMIHRYSGWVKGLQWDWLISRQRFFGVPFPIWYCKECNEIILADEKDLPVDPLKQEPGKKCKCGSSEFIPEKDVLDTWFTSSMTPQITVQLMNKEVQKRLFPMTLRPQAGDIISFWLFNTILKSNLHYKKNPFRDVTVSGFVKLHGEKMSKSKGNVFETQEVLGKYGADAMRYWAASSKFGEDIEYQEKEVITGKKLVNKMLNATNFIFMNLKNYKPKKTQLLETDLIFLNRLNDLIENATKSFENYEYHKVRLETDNFFWSIFCDNYLEIVKWRIYNGNKKEKESAYFVLYNSLLTIMKLFAPIMPFITEEIYQEYFRKHEGEKSIHISKWTETFKIKIKDN